MALLLGRAYCLRLAAPAVAGRRAAARPAVRQAVRQAKPLSARRLQPLRVIKESGAVKGQKGDDPNQPRDAWDPDWEENAGGDLPGEVPGESCEIQSCAIEPLVEPVENYEAKDDVRESKIVQFARGAALLIYTGADR